LNKTAVWLLALLALAGVAQAASYYFSVATGAGGGYYVGNNGGQQWRLGQRFSNLNATGANAWYVTHARFYLRTITGAPVENTLVRIEGVTGGAPNGTLVDPAFEAVLTPAQMIAGTWVTASFGNGTILPAGTYALVFRQQTEAEALNNYYDIAVSFGLGGAGLEYFKQGAGGWAAQVNENVTAGIHWLTIGLTVSVTDCISGDSIPYYNFRLWNATDSGYYHNATGYTHIFYNATTPASGTGLALTVNATWYEENTFSLPDLNATSAIDAAVCLTPKPRLTISVLDETTVTPLVSGVYLANSTTTKAFNGASNYNLTFANLAFGTTTITASATGYYNRTVTESITTLTAKNISLLLLPTNMSTSYTVYVRNLGGSAIPYVSYNVTKTVGGTTYTIATGTTDANGIFIINLHYGDTYSFTLAAGGYATATTDVTASTLNPITIVLYSSSSVPQWNTTLSSIIPEYWGQPLVQGETSIRTANASYWAYEYLEFTGAYAEYYYNNTLSLNSTSGPTYQTNTSLTIPLGYSGFVLQKFTVTANGTNNTFLTWIPILPRGSGGSPAYKSGIITLIAERLQAGDPTGLARGAVVFLVIIVSLLVATYIGGATVMSTLIFLL